MGDDTLVSLQDTSLEIRWTVRIRGDNESLDLMQSEILEILEDNHLTYEVHIKKLVSALYFCLISSNDISYIILLTVL